MNVSNKRLLLQTQNQVGHSTNIVAKSTERLASGLRINRAADDATGLNISEKMRSQIRGLDMAIDNATDGISMIQTAEGGMNAITDLLHRMRELAIKASSGVLTKQDTDNISNEFQECKKEIDRIAETTTFNGKKLLNINSGKIYVEKGMERTGTATSVAAARDIVDFSTVGDGTIIKIQHGDELYQFEYDYDNSKVSGETIGITLKGGETNEQKADLLTQAIEQASGNTLRANSYQRYSDDDRQHTLYILAKDPEENQKLTIDYEYHAPALQIGNSSDDIFYLTLRSMTTRDLGINNTGIQTFQDADKAILAIDDAFKKVVEQRVSLGVAQNSVEYTINRLNIERENTQASESRIRDIDMAKEMVSYVKNQIISNSSVGMLSQANQDNGDVLQLVKEEKS